MSCNRVASVVISMAIASVVFAAGPLPHSESSPDGNTMQDATSRAVPAYPNILWLAVSGDEHGLLLLAYESND